MDEFDVDEQGIFREKLPNISGLSPGILVDEEGVWRDEPLNDLGSHYSYRTANTDSGIGVDRTGKSSSADLNQYDYGSEEDYGVQNGGDAKEYNRNSSQGYTRNNSPPMRDRAEDGGMHQGKESSSQMDSKSTTSYHISELENSESQQEGLSFEQHSYDSEQALDFPELVDDSYLMSDQSNARPGVSGSHGNSEDHSLDLDKYVESSNYADVLRNFGHRLSGQGLARGSPKLQHSKTKQSNKHLHVNGYGAQNQSSRSPYPNSRSSSRQGQPLKSPLPQGQDSRSSSRQGYRSKSPYHHDSRSASRQGHGTKSPYPIDSRSSSRQGRNSRSSSRQGHESKIPISQGQRSRSHSRQSHGEPEEDIRVSEIYRKSAEALVEAALRDRSHSGSDVSSDEVSDIDEDYDAFQDNPADLAQRYNDPGVLPHLTKAANQKRAKKPSRHTTGNDEDRPPIEGDSIFTQEDRRQSLAEFEQIEAALENRIGNGGGASEGEGADHMDLIGAYLKGLKRREDDEDRQNDEEIAYHSDRQARDPPPPAPRDPSRLPVRTPDRSLTGSARRYASPGSPRVYDPDQNGYRHQPDSISLISGSVDEIMLEPSMDQPREGEPEARLDTLTDNRDFGDSLPFERSFEDTARRNQAYTSYSDVYTYYDDADDAYTYSDENSLQRPPTPSRIPILRSGSPTRSRPGSRSASRGGGPSSRSTSRGPGSRPSSRGPGNSRPGSPDRKPYGANNTGIPAPTQNTMKGPRRALPITPLTHQSSQSPPPSHRSVQSEHSGPPSVRSSHEAGQLPNHMSQAESELGRATKWLLMDEEDIHRKGMTSSKLAYDVTAEEEADTVPSLTHSPHSKTATPKSRMTGRKSRDSSPGKQESSPELRHSETESGGEELSQDLSQGSTVSKRELKSRYIQEVSNRKQQEETMDTLQTQYQDLLKKYAQAENVIDDLRLGAKVKLYVEGVQTGGSGTVPSGLQQGSLSKTYPMGTHGSLSTPTQMAHQAVVSSLQQSGVRPPSRNSFTGSLGAGGGGNNSSEAHSQGSQGPHPGTSAAAHPGASSAHPGTPQYSQGGDPGMSNDDLESLQGDGTKLALLVKAKAIEEQTNAFQILLDEKQLNLGDQSKALQNIKTNYEQLSHDYRTAKEDHDYRRRQGLLGDSANEPTFDENKEIDGELYKLNMRLDDLEHSVQANLKSVQSAARRPFSGKTGAGPMRGDHSLRASGTETGRGRGGAGNRGDESLNQDRQPSSGSLAGGASVDERLHALQKEYTQLMDGYRRLKGLQRTPERDQRIGAQLEKLRDVYERTPEHRRQPLPPELENQLKSELGLRGIRLDSYIPKRAIPKVFDWLKRYSSTTGTFVPALSLPDDENDQVSLRGYSPNRHQGDVDNVMTSSREESDVTPMASQPHRGRGEEGGRVGRRRSTMDSLTTAPSDYSRDGRRHAYGTESESDVPVPSRRGHPGKSTADDRSARRYSGDGTGRRLPRPGPGPRSRRAGSGRDLPSISGSGKSGNDLAPRSGSGSRVAGAGSGASRVGPRGVSMGTDSAGPSRARGVTSHTSPRGIGLGGEEEEYSDSDASSSGSADSVIYNARGRQGHAPGHGAGRQGHGGAGRQGHAIGQERPHSRAGLDLQSQDSSDARRSMEDDLQPQGHLGSRDPRSRSRSRGRRALEPSISEFSDEPKPSPRSTQLKSLTDEVARLKQHLQTGSTTTHPGAGVQNGYSQPGMQTANQTAMVPPFAFNQTNQNPALAASYTNPPVNQVPQATPIYANQAVNPSLVPPMVVNQPVQHGAVNAPVYAANQPVMNPAYASPLNGYGVDPYAAGFGYPGAYPGAYPGEEEGEEYYDDEYDEEYDSEPEYGPRRRRPNSIDGDRGYSPSRRGYSPSRRGYSPSRRDYSPHKRDFERESDRHFDRRSRSRGRHGYDDDDDNLYDGTDYGRSPLRRTARSDGDRYERSSRLGAGTTYSDPYDAESRLGRSRSRRYDDDGLGRDGDYSSPSRRARSRDGRRSGSRGSGYYSDSASRSPSRRHRRAAPETTDMRRYFLPSRDAARFASPSRSRSRGASPMRATTAYSQSPTTNPGAYYTQGMAQQVPLVALQPQNGTVPINGPMMNGGAMPVNAMPNMATIPQTNMANVPSSMAGIQNTLSSTPSMVQPNTMNGTQAGSYPQMQAAVGMSGTLPVQNGYSPYSTAGSIDGSQYLPNNANGLTNGFPGPSNGYQGQSNGYQGQSNGYQGQSTGYQGQPNGYNGQSNGYQGQPSGYQGQPNGYLGNSNNFQTNSNYPYHQSQGTLGNSLQGSNSQGPNSTSCPMCGNLGQHTHGELQFVPTNGGGSLMQSGPNSSGLVPVQIIPGSQNQRSKVRYYVREYGGESASEPETRVYRKTNKVKTYILEDGSERDEEYIEDPLQQAIQTANKLKHMSTRMRESLNDEINRSIKEGSYLLAH